LTISKERVQTGEATMDDSIIEDNCSDAVKQIDTISLHLKIELSILANHVNNRHKRLTESLSHLQELLDNLRADIKYQVFDLEATRREKSDLMTLLEYKDRLENQQD
jgi:hypothetical protein